jgi:DNA mismatch repair protein MutS
VAKLAGLPAVVIERARALLAELEKSEREAPKPVRLDDLPLFAARPRPPAAPAAERPDALRLALAAIEPDEMTPKEALEALYRLKAASRP